MKSVSLHDLVRFLNVEERNQNLPNVVLTRPVAIHDLENQDDSTLTWVSPKKLDSEIITPRGFVICNQDTSLFSALESSKKIIVTNPRQAFSKALQLFADSQVDTGIHSSAVVNSSQIGSGVVIGPNAFIDKNVVIGDNVIIGAGSVILENTRIGNDVIIGSNNTIGGVGFGYEKDDEGQYFFLAHLGGVVIEDRVEIGNNTCIDKGVLGNTVLGRNVKVDNLVHIAHGCQIGENSLIIANAMVAGSVEIGPGSWIAPSSSILNQKKIGKNVVVGMSAVVLKDVPDDDVVVGMPAKSISNK